MRQVWLSVEVDVIPILACQRDSGMSKRDDIVITAAGGGLEKDKNTCSTKLQPRCDLRSIFNWEICVEKCV